MVGTLLIFAIHHKQQDEGGGLSPCKQARGWGDRPPGDHSAIEVPGGDKAAVCELGSPGGETTPATGVRHPHN